MALPETLPTTVLTGFLGSGKTTLLRRALVSPALADTAVIINELGEIAIDHHLVDFVEGSVLELPGGCLCCAVREDLARTLRGLLDRRDAGEIRRFRRVVIETTGLADPAPILFTLGADPMLDHSLHLARVVTLVDAVNGADSLDRFAEAGRQAALADTLVITKTDLAPLGPDLVGRLDALNDRADRILAAETEDAGMVLFGDGKPPTAPAKPAEPVAVHTHGIDAFGVILEGALSRLDFARALGGLARERGTDLLRVKGIVRFSDRPERPAVVQAAQHAMFAPEWLDDWPDQDHRSRLVFIVHDIPRSEILAHFAFAAPPPLPSPACGGGLGWGLRHHWEASHARHRHLGRYSPSFPRVREPADIGVTGEKIAAIGAPGSLAALGAGRVVDAAGQIVIPGGIDPHVHCRWPIVVPGTTEHQLTEPASVVSRAALFGGTTTMIDFALVEAGDRVQQAIERRQKEWAGDCHCDYAFHTMVQGKIAPEILPQLAEAVEAGHPSVKIFTTDITPSRKGRMVDFGDIWEVLKVLAQAGGIAAIHAEDNDIVMHMYEKLFREDRTGFENMAEVHNTLSEDLSFNRVIRLAANIEGAALYMMHTSAATGVRAIAAARAKGVPIYGETLHQYLMYTAEDYKRPNGQIYHTYPSLKFREDQEALWKATDHGAIQTVATDEICCPLRIKLQGRRIDDTTGGNAGVEPRLSLIYTETVEKRGYGLSDFVGLVSANAAKIMGLYPRKGALAVGSDADIVLLDPRRRHTVRAAELHEADYSPWEGRDLAAWPSMTMLRGKIVVEGGTFTGDLKDGQFLPRKVPDEIRARPMV